MNQTQLITLETSPRYDGYGDVLIYISTFLRRVLNVQSYYLNSFLKKVLCIWIQKHVHLALYLHKVFQINKMTQDYPKPYGKHMDLYSSDKILNRLSGGRMLIFSAVWVNRVSELYFTFCGFVLIPYSTMHTVYLHDICIQSYHCTLLVLCQKRQVTR